MTMDKYGVEIEKPKGEKTAQDFTACSYCGSPLSTSANVPKCPTCGTKPYEKKEEDADDGSQSQEG